MYFRSFILILSFSFFACQTTTENLSTTTETIVFTDSVDIVINKRIALMDVRFFSSDSLALLRPEQKKLLYPIIGRKIMALAAAKQEAKNKSELKAVRKAIQNDWHPKISAVLDTQQILLRDAMLVLSGIK
jgi:thioredoxin-related protein